MSGVPVDTRRRFKVDTTSHQRWNDIVSLQVSVWSKFDWLLITYSLHPFGGFLSLNHILFMLMLSESWCLKKYPTEMFCKKKEVLKNFATVTRKHLCWILFLTKLQAFKCATLLKRDSNTDAIPWKLKKFFNIFWRTSVNEYFCVWPLIMHQ